MVDLLVLAADHVSAALAVRAKATRSAGGSSPATHETANVPVPPRVGAEIDQAAAFSSDQSPVLMR
jgi:hypothetical protein